MLELCAEAGADTLLCTSAIAPTAIARSEEHEALLRDLRKLIMPACREPAVVPRIHVFPGESSRSEILAGLMRHLDQLGLRGTYGFDIFNADYRRMPPAAAALRSLRAAQWLGEDVLRRSVPSPSRMRLRRP